MRYLNRNHKKNQKRWSLAFCTILMALFIANIALGLERVTGISQRTVSAVCKAGVVLSIGMCTGDLLDRDITPLIVIAVSSFFACLIHIIVFPSLNTWFIPALKEYITLCIPMMICVLMIDDQEMLFQTLLVTSAIIGLASGVLMLSFGGSFFEDYSMGFSNSLVVPTDILVLGALDKRQNLRKRLSFAVLASTCALAMTLYGSRGSLIAVVLFILSYIVLSQSISSYRTILKVGLLMLLVLVLLNFDTLISSASEAALRMGFHSRTLSILSTNVGYDSGRTALWNTTWNDIRRDPFIVRGLCSDYALLGIYCHNIALALWHNLGMLFGTIMLVHIILLSVVTIHKYSLKSSYLPLVLFWGFFPIILWSGNVWLDCYFWSWYAIMCRDTYRK